MGWNKDIKREMLKRNVWCKVNYGDDHTYAVNDDPYIRPKNSEDEDALEEMKKADPFLYDYNTRHTQCVASIKPVISDDNRYYKNIFGKDQCDMIRGEWDQTALNRDNKVSKGVCWTNPSNSYCGSKMNPKYAKNNHNKFIKDIDVKKCESASLEKCKWDTSIYDCTVSNEDSVHENSTDFPAEMPNDMRKGMESFLEMWYNIRNNKKYTGMFDKDAPIINNPYPIKGEKNRCLNKMGNKDIVSPSKTYPSIVQSILNATMKNIASYPDNTNRGILAWHSTGSGKTCTGMGIIDAFWDSKTKFRVKKGGPDVYVDRQIIFASSIAGINANSDETFAQCGRLFYDRFKTKKYDPPKNKEEKDAAKSIIKTIVSDMRDRYIMRLTFAKLANRIEKTEGYKSKKKFPTWYGGDLNISRDEWVDLDNTVLIVDEVQDVFQPIGNQKKEYALIREVLTDVAKHPALKIVILTATPGNSVDDVMTLMNMVRNPNDSYIKPPKNFEDEKLTTQFSNQIRGLVSFLDMSHDLTKFPLLVDNEILEEFNLGPEQYEMYVANYLKTIDSKTSKEKNWKDLEKLGKTKDYWKNARQFANTMGGMYHTSSKLPVLVERIKAFPNDKHYIYSTFSNSHGLNAIIDALDKIDYKEFNLGSDISDIKENSSKRKRFMVLNNSALSPKTNSQKSLDAAANNLKKLVDVYNDKDNLNGQLVHVMLASDGYNQGVDLRGVKHIHIFEPFLKLLSDKQVIGRAVRHCSHSDYNDQKDWTVTIHRYAMGLEESTYTRKKGKKIEDIDIENIDRKIYNEAVDRNRDLFLLYNLIQEAAIDCRVLIKFHKDNNTDYGHLSCFEYPQSANENSKIKKNKEAVIEKKNHDLRQRYDSIIKNNNERQLEDITDENKNLVRKIEELKKKKIEFKEEMERDEIRREKEKRRAEKDKQKKEEKEAQLIIEKKEKEARQNKERIEKIAKYQLQMEKLKSSRSEIKRAIEKYEKVMSSIAKQAEAIYKTKASKQKSIMDKIGILGSHHVHRYNTAVEKLKELYASRATIEGDIRIYNKKIEQLRM